MAENLGAKFSIDVTNLKAGLKQANQLIRESESEFKAAAAGMDDWTKSEEGLTKKLKSLNDITQIQQQKVDALKAEYKRLIDNGLDPSSDKASQLRTQINKETESLEKNKKEAEKTEKALDDLGNETDDLADKTAKTAGTDGKTGLGAMDVALGNLASTIATKALGALKDLAGAIYDAYKEMDKGQDEAIKATGATGEAADKLRENYKAVASEFKADSEDIGKALGEVSTRFGFTGENLEDATLLFLKFAEITGTDAKTAVADVSKAMQKAGIDNRSYATILDMIASASQASGISVSNLTDNLTKYGTALKNMGFDTSEAIALFSQLELSGVNAEQVFTGLQKASAKWTKEGKDTREEFAKLIDDIKNSRTNTEAGKKAIEALGSKAGPEFAEAVRGGKFEYNELITTIQNSKGNIEGVFDETLSAVDKIDLEFYRVKQEWAEEVESFVNDNQEIIKFSLELLTTWLKGARLLVQDWFNFWEKVGAWIFDMIDGIKTAFSDFIDSIEVGYNSLYKWGQSWGESVDTPRLIDTNEWKILWDVVGNVTSNKMATGGVVRQATAAIIGEDGAEAVVPLEKNTGWIDMLAEKLGGKAGGVTVNQTNNYASAHSRYEIFKSQQNVERAVKLALMG